MRDIPQTQYLRRFSLWLLGQALPESGALRRPARLALLSVVVAAAAGTLLSLAVVAGLTALFFYLQSEGLGTGVNLALVSAVGLLMALVTYLVARGQLDRVPDSLDELQLFRHPSNDIFGELARMTVGGFIEGMADKSAKAAATAEAEADDITERLIAALESLDARLDQLEAQVEEAAQDVVHELERPRKRRR